MTTYKLVKRNQNPKNNENGKQEHLLITRGKGGMIAVPCYRIETEIISEDLTFDEAKELRKSNKGSEIVKE
jgi:hypothetical protein